MTKCQKDPACAIFLKRGLFKDIKNYIPVCQTHKYKNTNTQIQHMTNCQKDPQCGIFWKRRLIQGYLLSLAYLYKVWVFPLLADQDADIKVQMFVLRKDTADILGRKKKLD